MRRWTRILLGGLLLLGIAFVTLVDVQIPSRPIRPIDSLSEPRERPMNVVFLLVDTLRSDRLSSYGYSRQTSPMLDELVSSGVRFAHVEAQSSWTKTSMASLWTGVFPARTGVLRFDHKIPAGARMPAEIFQEAGYTTAGIWRNGWVAPNFGFGRGFDIYIRPKQRTEDPEDLQRALPGTRKVPGTDLDIGLAAIEFLKAQGDEPFMLYLHYMGIHQYSYDPEAADQGFGSSLSDSYDAAIHFTDRHVNWLVEELEQLGLLDNTLVVLASDHGEAFREHRIEGHAKNLFTEVTEVPLLFVLPIRLPEPLVVEPLVRNVDIWPTILDIVGLPGLPDADGQSLMPLMLATARGETIETPPSFAYLDTHWGKMHLEPSPLVSVRESGLGRVAWKPGDPQRSLRIFDHQTDPAEQKNLAKRPPEWSAAMRADLETRLELPLAWGEPEEVETDDMYKAQLRALGYVVN